MASPSIKSSSNAKPSGISTGETRHSGNDSDRKVHENITHQLDTVIVNSNSSSIPKSVRPLFLAKCEAYIGCSFLQLVSVITVIASLILLAFTICYLKGFFPAESFIGPIGSTVFPTVGGLFVFFSGLLVFCSFRTTQFME